MFAYFDSHISLLLFSEVKKLCYQLTQLQAAFIYSENFSIDGRCKRTDLQ